MVDGWRDMRVDGWMGDGWMDRWMVDGWIHGWMSSRQIGKQSYVMENTRRQYNRVGF